MPKSTLALNNFTSGVMSPELQGRIDTEQYRASADTIENMIVKYYGGVEATPGTRMAHEVKDSSKETIVTDFIFSDEQAYILEFGDEYMRVFKDDGIVVSGAVPYELPTPFTESMLDSLRFVPTADLSYIFTPDYKPQVLSRTGHTSWSIANFAFEKGPLLPSNITSTTITPSAATGTGITLTASVAIFHEDHIGSIWRVKDGYVEIKTCASGGLKTTCTADVLYSGNLGGTSAYTDWAEGAWSDYRGWPSCACFYEDRLWVAATNHSPQTIWGSQTGDYESFDEAATSNPALSFTPKEDKMNRIYWLAPTENYLAYGTSGGIGKIWSGSSAEPIAEDNSIQRPMSTFGSCNLPAIKVGDMINYFQRDGYISREIIYNQNMETTQILETNLFSRSLTEATIVDMAYQQAPDSILWCVTADGDIATMTRNVEQKIAAWTLQTTDGDYESIACIPKGTYNQVWVVVKRGTKRFIEYFAPPTFENIEDYCGLHSSLEYDGAEATIITGATHLEGELVSVLADGMVHPDCTVASGSITLDWPASVVQLGLPRTATLKLLPIEAGSMIGSARAKVKRCHTMDIQFYKTVGAEIGNGEGDYDDIPFGPPTNYDTALVPFTGLIENITPPKLGYDKSAKIEIRQSKPLPMTILGIYPFLTTNDG